MSKVTTQELIQAIKCIYRSILEDEEKYLNKLEQNISKMFNIPQAADMILDDLTTIVEKINFYSVIFTLGIPPEQWHLYSKDLLKGLSNEQLDSISESMLKLTAYIRIIAEDKKLQIVLNK